MRFFLPGLLLLCPAAWCAETVLTAGEKELLATGAAEYRAAVLEPEIPRAFDVHRSGCPVCGDAIQKHGRYSWILDKNKPFKVQCPECRTVFPDNDFAAYWKSGCKDRSLLKGKYVDDGRGWRPPQGGAKYWFVAYYHHWSFKKWNPVKKLSLAYERTGNPEFARRGLAVLDRYAEYYPRYNYNKQSRYAEEVLPTYDGRILNYIWETDTASNFADSYARLKPFLQSPDAALQQVTGKTNDAVQRNIEQNMLRVMAGDIMSENRKIQGNFGMHQVALLKIAAVLRDPAMIRWVTDYRTTKNDLSVPLDYVMYCNIFGDGAPVESPQYNSYWIEMMTGIFRALQKNGVDVMARYPKARLLFTYPAKLLVCGRFTPSFGDTGALSAHECFSGIPACRKWIAGLDPAPENIGLEQIGNPQQDPLFGYRSNLLSRYGTASLQNAFPPKPTAVWLTFGGYTRHRHLDALHAEMFAENAPLAPDFGYPDSASADDPRLFAFDGNTVAHNTVVVDARRQKYCAALLLHFDAGHAVQRVEAEAPEAYPGKGNVYRRALLVCEVAPGKTVVFDRFHVKGGKQHDWFMHGAGETFSGNVQVSAPRPGTLAGENVAFGEMYDSPAHQGKPGTVRNYSGYCGSGFQYLTAVRSVTVRPDAMLEFPVASGRKFQPEKGAALRLFLLPEAGETWQLAQGTPPATQKNPQKHLMFLDRRRTGAAPLESQFLTVWENVSERNPPAIARVEKIHPAAVRITFAGGGKLYCFDAETPVDFSCDGFRFRGRSGAVLMDDKGKILQAGHFCGGEISRDGKSIVASQPALSAKITAADLQNNILTLDRAIPAAYTGRMFRAGRYAYRAAKIAGKQVALLDQSPLAGRFRFTSVKGRTGTAMTDLVLVSPGMTLYDGDRKTVLGKVETCRGRMLTVSGSVPLKTGRDYWVSECGPGDIVEFEDSDHLPNQKKGETEMKTMKWLFGGMICGSMALLQAETVPLTAADFHASPNVTAKDGVITVVKNTKLKSRKLFAIDPGKRYTLKGTVRSSTGKTGAPLYIGFIPLDASGQMIEMMMMMAVPSVSGVLTEPAAKGSTLLTVQSAPDAVWRSNWVAFGAKDDLSDLPNRNIVKVKEAKQQNGVWQLTLRGPLPFAAAAGTAVRQHNGGAAYLYIAEFGKGVPAAWTAYSGTTSGIRKAGWSSREWPHATVSAQIVILANWVEPTGSVELKDLQLVIE